MGFCKGGRVESDLTIRLQDVSFRYGSGIDALRRVSCTIEPGERVAIVGQNGAGKTTLAKHLNGLLRPLEGQVLVGDWDTQKHTVGQMAHRVGYLFQNPDDQLFARSVRAEVSFGPKNLGFREAETARLVEEALELCGLEDVSEANPYDLHPGKRKMVALASVLAMDVPILVLDEPTTGQDARNVGRMGQIVQEANRRHKTVVAITHDIDFAAEQFERMLVMRQGELVLDGPVQEVLSRPDVLETTYVQVSQLTRLGQALGLEPPARTEEEFLEIYRAHLKN